MTENNNPFASLTTDGLEAARDVLGGGGAIDSDAYDGVIKLAYTGKSSGGAHFLAVHIDINGREYRETLYVTNKQGQNFYHPKGDQSKKAPLPGFTTANDLALLSTGQALNEQTFEEKVVKLYDFDARQELPQKVTAVTSMMGQEIAVGILKNIEDKTKLNEGTGNYDPTGETRETNNIDKVFHAETKKTVSEFTAKVESAEFYGKWVNKNKGQVRDKSTGASGKAGVPGSKAPGGAAKSAAPSKSLFG